MSEAKQWSSNICQLNYYFKKSNTHLDLIDKGDV